MYCARCSRELRIVREQIGFDQRRNPIFHHIAYCDFCRTKQDLDDENNMQSYSISYGPNGIPVDNPKYTSYPIYGNTPQSTRSNKNGTGILLPLVIAFLVIGFFVMIGVGVSYARNQKNASATNVNASQSSNNTTSLNTTPKTNDPGIAVSPNDSLKVGDIGVINNIYLGLSYVKRMSYLPNMDGEGDDLGPDREVILAFFEFYNNTNSYASVEPYSITCYVDGYQVEDVDVIRKVKCDGILQYSKEKIADHSQMISVQDFDVPVNWSEMKLYYKSECIWTVHQEDVKTEEYVFQTMYPKLAVTRTPVNVGDVVYRGDYEVTFQGVTEYIKTGKWSGDRPYVIFMYTIHNTGKNPIDYKKVGYRMKAYQNNYFIGDADYTLDSQIDGYSSIFNIDSIEPGMSANICLAFDQLFTMENSHDYYMIYDEGYGSDRIRATVYYTGEDM